MIILAIETSCDDTAISIIEAKGGFRSPVFRVLSHNVSSQIDVHKEWGGVVPSLAKREHSKNLIPLLTKAIKESSKVASQNFETKLRQTRSSKLQLKNHKTLIISVREAKSYNLTANAFLDREPELKEQFLKIMPALPIPKIDAIAVTEGPGLEPALWVGINFAKALSAVWNKPLIPVNHLEGHVLSSLIGESLVVNRQLFPTLALIVSGGHTELVLSKDWLKYKIIGQTRDDAVGEAFDKVARILGLPYPGGPEISKLADKVKLSGSKSFPRKSAFDSLSSAITLPRPMIKSNDFDFSFSGLKTSVLYLVQNLKKENKFNQNIKAAIAREFQQACIDVLITKTEKTIRKFKAKTLVVGGGVIANKELRRQFENKMKNEFPAVKLLIPNQKFTTDNATMIAIAAYFRKFATKKQNPARLIKAQGGMRLK